jgi:hypothetical protein
MSISYDGFSQGSGTGATVTVNHTPGASAKAITAQISHVGSTDRVTGVTYGGVAMTRVRSDADTTGANPDSQGRSYFYELLAGIPSGAQNCVVSRGGTEEVNVVVTSLAANAAIERLAHAGAVATQDLSISLDPGGRTGFGLAAGWTGANSFPIPATGTARYGYISRPSGAEDWSMGALRASAPATSAWVPVWTQTNANNAMSGAIYAEVVTPPPAAVTSDFLCGAECGIARAGNVVTPDNRHWHEEGATPPVIQTAIARQGGRAFRFQPSNSTSYLGRISAGTDRWHRFYVYFASLPTKNAAILRHSVAAGDSPGLIYRPTTQDLVPAVGNTYGAGAMPVVVGKWYRIECLASVGAGTRVMKMRYCAATQADPWADGAATALADASLAQAASTFTGWRIGAAAATSPIADVVVDDIRTGAVSGDYPVAAGSIVACQPLADGTHNYNTAGDFQDSLGGNIALAATDTWTRVTGLLDNTEASFNRAANPAAGEYLEWATAAPMSSVAAVEIVSIHLSGGANPNKQTLRWRSAGVDADVFTDADFSEVVPIQHSKHYLQMPGAVAMTPALIGSSRWRWGSSWTAPDVDSVPFIAGVLMEVEGVLTAAPPPPPTNPERNPVHTFPEAGTYTVTLTVRDNLGATHSISQQITVP